MTLDELITNLTELRDMWPEAGKRPVRWLGDAGSKEVIIIYMSDAEEVYLAE